MLEYQLELRKTVELLNKLPNGKGQKAICALTRASDAITMGDRTGFVIAMIACQAELKSLGQSLFN